MNPRQKRLDNEYRELRSTFDADPLVEIVAIGPVPAEKYRIVYKVPSLRLNGKSQPIKVDATVVEIELPQGYPKVPPVARTIAGDVVFHPNFNSTKICLADHWAPSTQLVDLIKEIGEMLQWQKFNIRSPLNAQAAQWSQEHKSEIPLSKHKIGSGIITVKLK
jgi:ubiquitin-protein ligase